MAIPLIKGGWSPAERAHRLLLRNLNPMQKKQYLDYGYFDVVGSEGHTFRMIHGNISGSRGLGVRVLEIDTPEARHSYVTRNMWLECYEGGYLRFLPEGDQLLGMKMMLEVDERFKNRGCHSYLAKEKFPLWFPRLTKEERKLLRAH